MFYSQSVENIQLIILSLDGGLLDLNRLRFNYFKHTCKTYNHVISRDEFSLCLGNMNTMYQCSPIQDIISNQELNKIIEKDMFEYAKLKQNIKKEGVDELLQFCHQKHMKIAVVSTHKSKRAIQYLQLTGIYKYIDFVIGGDSQLKPLPNQDVLETICQQMNIEPKNTLVVANYQSLVIAANKILANIVYMPDLVQPTKQIEASVYRIARNNLEVINIFLFSKYDSVEIFSPVLGMSRQMSQQVLTSTYHQLLKKYQGDKQLIDLVNRTYNHFLNLLQEDRIKSQQLEEKLRHENLQIFDQEKQQTHDELIFTDEEHSEDIFEENNGQHFSFHDDHKEIKNKEISQKLSKEKAVISSNSPTSAISLNAERMNELMDIINGNAQENVKEKDEEIKQDQDVEEKEEQGFLYKVIDFIYIILISTIVVLGFMIANVGLSDYLSNDSITSHIINSIINFYFSIVNGFYSLIFDSLNYLIQFIPDYNHLLNSHGFLSPLATQTLLFIIFNTAVIYLCRLVYHLISKKNDKDEDEIDHD